MNTNLPCHYQDYLEIACLFGYRLEVNLKNGEQLCGIAKDIVSTKGQERLQLLSQDASITHTDTSNIASIKVLTPNARFDHMSFV